jgi:hypothetical protein
LISSFPYFSSSYHSFSPVPTISSGRHSLSFTSFCFSFSFNDTQTLKMPHLHPAGQALTSRRKRALDETNFITHDVDSEEGDRTTARVQRQRTSSTTSVETIRVRPATKAKIPVLGLGVGKPLVALTVPKSLRSSSVGSKIPIPTSTIKATTSTPPHDDKPLKSILKNPKLANLGAVAQTGPVVAHQPVAYQHEPLVVNELRVIADETRVEEDVDMDMDMIPCIPSPPESPPLRASTVAPTPGSGVPATALQSSVGDTQPPSTPMPTPTPPTSTSAHHTEPSNSSNPVSTVKGTKKRHSNSSAKGKTPSISFPSIDAKTKGGKTKPLVSLCLNTSQAQKISTNSSTDICAKSSDSLVGIKSLDSQFKSSPLSNKSAQDQGNNPQDRTKQPQMSTAKIDKWGCVHLGAADCELAMTFPLPHCEVWDMRDE